VIFLPAGLGPVFVSLLSTQPDYTTPESAKAMTAVHKTEITVLSRFIEVPPSWVYQEYTTGE